MTSTPGDEFFHSIARDEKFIEVLLIVNKEFFSIDTLVEKLENMVARMEAAGYEDFTSEKEEKLKARILKQTSRESFVGIHVQSQQQKNGFRVPGGLRTTLKNNFLSVVKHKMGLDHPLSVA
jgi:hypothetical protein